MDNDKEKDHNNYLSEKKKRMEIKKKKKINTITKILRNTKLLLKQE